MFFKILSYENKSDCEQWNNEIEQYFNNEPMLKPDYVKLFCSKEDKCLAAYIEEDNQKIIYPFILRTIPNNEQYKDITNAYGYGGPTYSGKVSNEFKNEFWKNLESWYKSNNVVSEFIRFSLFDIENISFPGKIEKKMLNVVKDLNISQEEILTTVEHKVRKNVKKANTYNLKIEVDLEGNKIDDFLNVYYSTMERCNAKESYYFNKEFFETINTKLKENFAYFNVYYEDKIISTELVLLSNENMYSYLGGTLAEYFDYRPNDFLKYEIIRWGIQNGYKRFILGGGYGEEDGIFKYKKCFAPDGIYDFYIGKKIWNQEKYSELCKMKNIDKQEEFFPAYRKG